MEAILRTYLIGRSSFADIVLADESVASRHAELVVTDDGAFYLTDCATERGTWRAAPGKKEHGKEAGVAWQPLRQDFVTRDHLLRFGNYRCRIDDLLGTASTVSRGKTTAAVGTEIDAEPSARKKGPVERDPITGQIVRKRV